MPKITFKKNEHLHLPEGTNFVVDANDELWDDRALVEAYDCAINRIKEKIENEVPKKVVLCRKRRLKSLSYDSNSEPVIDELLQKSDEAPSAGGQLKTQWNVRDECYCLYYTNNLLYKARIISIDKSSDTPVVVQFVDFNIRQQTQLCDIYPVTAITMSETYDNSEIVYNPYKIGDKCKIFNDNNIQTVKIDSMCWIENIKVNVNGQQYTHFSPIYSVICDDGQLIDELNEEALIPINFNGTYDEYINLSNNVISSIPKRPYEFHFNDPQLIEGIRSKLNHLKNILDGATLDIDEKTVNESWFIAGFVTGFYKASKPNHLD